MGQDYEPYWIGQTRFFVVVQDLRGRVVYQASSRSVKCFLSDFVISEWVSSKGSSEFKFPFYEMSVVCLSIDRAGETTRPISFKFATNTSTEPVAYKRKGILKMKSLPLPFAYYTKKHVL